MLPMVRPGWRLRGTSAEAGQTPQGPADDVTRPDERLPHRSSRPGGGAGCGPAHHGAVSSPWVPVYTHLARSHQWIEQRSLTLHEAVARKLEAQPELLEVARANLCRWRNTNPTQALQEWQGLLDRLPLPQLRAMLRSPTEAAARLRQSSPFAGLLAPIETDLYPRDASEKSDLLDGAIGELSAFRETFGYYAHGIDETTATWPAGWVERLVPVHNENTGGATGWCLEVHDLAVSKLVAGRDRDIEFLRVLLTEGMADPAVLSRRVDALSLPGHRVGALRARLEQLARPTR
jgi:hypothetical protein